MEPFHKGYSNTPFRLIPGSQGQVWQLTKIGDQILAGHNLGTFLIENQQIKPISSLVGGWFTTTVPNRPDLLLQATYTGLGLLKKGADDQWQLSKKLEGFSKPLKKVLFDERGKVWDINPHKGLFLFELDAQYEKIVSQRQFTQKEGLPTEFRPDIFKVGEALIIKAGEQFYRWNDSQMALSPFDSLGQLDLSPGNYKVISFSEREYFKIFPNYVEWYRDGKKQKLNISLVFNNEQILALNKDLILFCLDQGYALLNRSKEKPESQEIPLPLISEIKVNGEHSIYPLFQENKQPWVFAPSEDQLQFFVSLPGLVKNTFLEYRLLGYQKDWQPLSANLSKEFTNLPPGDYQFQLSVKDRADIQDFSFSILPKWYETNLAKVIYFLLFGVGLWSLFLLQEKRIKLHIRKLQIEKERQLHLQRIEARNEQLQINVLNKTKELASSTMNLIQKNEILIKIKNQLNQVQSNISNKTSMTEMQKLVHIIDHHLTNEQDWELFEKNFTQVHESFLKKLKQDYPDLTPGDLKLAAYLKMNLSSKEIAPLLNISIRGVENKRYRLRSKLNLQPHDNLIEFMMRY